MITLILAIVIFLCCIAMLSIGVMFSRKPIQGGCCGESKLSIIIGGKRKPLNKMRESK
ncbi:hypothetical protein [Vibrio sp. HN007]|uniref:hypothetical protein n=1 Tax=Vibrio iocasae TaxID=3098914 RepID=UPI0035D4631D